MSRINDKKTDVSQPFRQEAWSPGPEDANPRRRTDVSQPFKQEAGSPGPEDATPRRKIDVSQSFRQNLCRLEQVKSRTDARRLQAQSVIFAMSCP